MVVEGGVVEPWPKRVFGSLGLILSLVTSNVSMLIRKTKYKLIIKLTA
jgi:hypothetical protein